MTTRENGEQRGVGGGENGDFAGVALARLYRETPATRRPTTWTMEAALIFDRDFQAALLRQRTATTAARHNPRPAGTFMAGSTTHLVLMAVEKACPGALTASGRYLRARAISK